MNSLKIHWKLSGLQPINLRVTMDRATCEPVHWQLVVLVRLLNVSLNLQTIWALCMKLNHCYHSRLPLATTRGMDGVFQYLCHDLCCIVCWIKWFRPAGRNIQLQTVYSTVQNPNLLRLLRERESFARNQQHTQATSLLHWLDKTPPARNMNFAAKVPSRSCKSNYSTTRAELAQ